MEQMYSRKNVVIAPEEVRERVETVGQVATPLEPLARHKTEAANEGRSDHPRRTLSDSIPYGAHRRHDQQRAAQQKERVDGAYRRAQVRGGLSEECRLFGASGKVDSEHHGEYRHIAENEDPHSGFT